MRVIERDEREKERDRRALKSRGGPFALYICSSVLCEVFNELLGLLNSMCIISEGKGSY